MNYYSLIDLLTVEQKLLLQKIKDKNDECYRLPVAEGEKIIGFGALLDFYMFWIARKKGTVYLRARRQFCKPTYHNTVDIPFRRQNEDLLFRAIEGIYQNYLLYKEDPEKFQAKLPQSHKAGDPLFEEAFRHSRWNAVKEEIQDLLNAYAAKDLAFDSFHVPNTEAAHDINDIFDEILDYLSSLASRPSNAFDIFRQYTESDGITLANIGDEYDLSRERIRQLCVKGKRRFIGIFKRAVKKDNILLGHLNRLADAIGSLGDGSIDGSLLLALPSFGKRKKAFFIELLWGTDVHELLDSFTEEAKKIESKNCTALKIVNELQAKICYPSDKVAPSPRPASIPKEEKLTYVEKFKKKLQGISDHVTFIEDPDIVYHTSTQTEHRPNFLLTQKDGRCVLVVLVSIKNIAVFYNVSRFNQLHEYCAKNGYGYLIMTNSGKSIYDLMALELDPALIAELNGLLETKKRILWPDMESLKARYAINDANIAAYVLQNKLSFSRKPFCIQAKRP